MALSTFLHLPVKSLPVHLTGSKDGIFSIAARVSCTECHEEIKTFDVHTCEDTSYKIACPLCGKVFFAFDRRW
jgi:hypothetical protein